MALKAYNKMKEDCFRLNMREFVEYFTDTVTWRFPVLVLAMQHQISPEI